MKKIWFLAVLVFGLSGCAGMVFETGVRKEAEISNQSMFIMNSKTIHYKSALYKSGFQRFNQVSKTPEPEPSQALIKFKNAFLENTALIFKEEGYEFVETQNNSLEKPPIYVEIRIAFQRGIPPLIGSIGATRWFVYINGEYAFEVYEWDVASLIGIGGEGSAGQDLSRKSVVDFLKQIKKISNKPQAQSP